jgi:hypothetical protein
LIRRSLPLSGNGGATATAITSRHFTFAPSTARAGQAQRESSASPKELLLLVQSDTSSFVLDLLIALAFTREEAPPVGRLFDRLLDP